MARITSTGLITGASGRIGNVVTYKLNGVQVVRTLPAKFKKHKPSVLQNKHRSSFQVQHIVARCVKGSVIDRVWGKASFVGGMNAYNYFIRINRAAYGDSDKIEFPELMTISEGSLLPAHELKVEKHDSFIDITWNTAGGGKNAMSSDKLNVVVIDPGRTLLSFVEVQATREFGSTRVNLPKLMKDVTEGFVFWSAYKDAAFSPSMYWSCGK